MTKVRRIMLALSSALLLESVGMTALSTSTLVEAVQKQSQTLIAVGGSLSQQERQQTLDLLGAANAPGAQVLSVDGNLINKYLNDGSNQSTQVFSSVTIEPREAGFGVQVQVITPRNIQKVTPIMYQNAAITSGAKNVLIKIASVREVTGEGALAGVYALYDKLGFKVSPKAIKVAEKEITVLRNIKEKGKLSDAQANVALAHIKKDVVKQRIQHQKVEVQQIEVIVNQCISIYNLTINEAERKELVEYGKQFAEIDIEQQEETVNQLDQLVMSQAWEAILESLTTSMSNDQLLQWEKQDYNNHDVYPAIIQALHNKAYEYLKTQQFANLEQLYTHTFAIEKMLGTVNQETMDALNTIRTVCYFALSNAYDTQLSSVTGDNRYPTVREQWLFNLRQAQQLAQDVELKEVFNRVSVATGMSPEALLCTDVVDGEWIKLTYVPSLLTSGNEGIQVGYNVITGDIGEFQAGQEQPQATRSALDCQALYGVAVDNRYVSLTTITPEYHLPSYVDQLRQGEEVDLVPNQQDTEEKESVDSSSFQVDPLLAGDHFITGHTDEDLWLSVVQPDGSYVPSDMVYPFFQRKDDGTFEMNLFTDVMGRGVDVGAEYVIGSVKDPSRVVRVTVQENADRPLKPEIVRIDNENQQLIGRTNSNIHVGQFVIGGGGRDQWVQSDANGEFVLDMNFSPNDTVLIITQAQDRRHSNYVELTGADILAQGTQTQATQEGQTSPAAMVQPTLQPITTEGKIQGTFPANTAYKIIFEGIGEVSDVSSESGEVNFALDGTTLPAGTRVTVQLQGTDGNWQDVLVTNVEGNPNEPMSQEAASTPEAVAESTSQEDAQPDPVSESTAQDAPQESVVDFSQARAGDSTLVVLTKPHYTVAIQSRAYKNGQEMTAQADGVARFDAQLPEAVTHFEGDVIHYSVYDESYNVVENGEYTIPFNPDQPQQPHVEAMAIGDTSIYGVTEPNADVTLIFRTDGEDYFNIQGSGKFMLVTKADSQGVFELELGKAYYALTGPHTPATPQEIMSGMKLAIFVTKPSQSPHGSGRLMSEPIFVEVRE